MTIQQANHHDADIILKLYDIRREPVMRESRLKMVMEFMPSSFDEAAAVMDPKHPLNAAFRQTTGYWEMAYSFVKHGAVHVDMMMECNGEGLFLYGKFEPFIEELREKKSPTMFNNTRWVVENTAFGKERMPMIRQRIAQMQAAK
jgi:hypothetical protein